MQLRVRDVARVLNVSEKTVYHWVEKGSLAAQQVNGQYRFNRTELLEWATEHNMTVSPGLFSEQDPDAAPLPSLAESLEAGGVFHGVPGVDMKSVLRAIVERMRLPDAADRELLFSVLLAREALGSTAVGEGIAIPHVRNPIVLHVERPIITLCFLEKPIEFGALDAKPVYALFSMISPTIRSHLHLLSRLGFALRDVKFKKFIAGRAPIEVILAEVRRIESGLPPADVGKEPA